MSSEWEYRIQEGEGARETNKRFPLHQYSWEERTPTNFMTSVSCNRKSDRVWVSSLLLARAPFADVDNYTTKIVRSFLCDIHNNEVQLEQHIQINSLLMITGAFVGELVDSPVFDHQMKLASHELLNERDGAWRFGRIKTKNDQLSSLLLTQWERSFQQNAHLEIYPIS